MESPRRVTNGDAQTKARRQREANTIGEIVADRSVLQFAIFDVACARIRDRRSETAAREARVLKGSLSRANR